MVRREEQAWDPAARIILDSRTGAHAGSGVNNSLEWAVSAAASIGLRFIEDGYRLQMFEADGPIELGSEAAVNRNTAGDLLISRLTDLRPRHTYSLRYALEAASVDQAGELVVAIMGRLTVDDAHALLRVRRQRTQGLALLLDVDTFSRAMPGADDHHRPASAGGHHGSHPNGHHGRQPDDRHAAAGHRRPGSEGHRRAGMDEAVQLLTSEGWRVVRVRRGMSIGDAWAQLDGAPRPRPAGSTAGASVGSPVGSTPPPAAMQSEAV
jgi:hypothetical protein